MRYTASRWEAGFAKAAWAETNSSTPRHRGMRSLNPPLDDRYVLFEWDAHVLAEIVRLDRAHHRPVAGDSDDGEAIKLVARSHQTMVWERTRHVLRLHSTLREYFPAALDTFADLDEPEALELLAAAPDPDRAARLSKAKITGALKCARRRNIAERAVEFQGGLRADTLRQPAAVQTAFAAITVSERLITALDKEIGTLGEVVVSILAVTRTLRSTPANPASGVILGSRVLAEFGDDPRIASPTAKAARTTPPLRRSLVRPERRKSCWPATHATPAWPMRCSNGHCPHCADRPARAYYDQLREGRSAIRPRYGAWPTATSASCTAGMFAAHGAVMPMRQAGVDRTGLGEGEA